MVEYTITSISDWNNFLSDIYEYNQNSSAESRKATITADLDYTNDVYPSYTANTIYNVDIDGGNNSIIKANFTTAATNTTHKIFPIDAILNNCTISNVIFDNCAVTSPYGDVYFIYGASVDNIHFRGCQIVTQATFTWIYCSVKLMRTTTFSTVRCKTYCGFQLINAEIQYCANVDTVILQDANTTSFCFYAQNISFSFARTFFENGTTASGSPTIVVFRGYGGSSSLNTSYCAITFTAMDGFTKRAVYDIGRGISAYYDTNLMGSDIETPDERYIKPATTAQLQDKNWLSERGYIF